MMEKIDNALIPTIKLSSGEVIPSIGVGTFGNDRYDPTRVADGVYGSVKAGYRLIDCAEAYRNEKEIGDAITKLLDEGIVKREELFISSKVWNDGHRVVRERCVNTLKNLGIDQLDLYLVHWPVPNTHAFGAAHDDRDPNAVPFTVEEYMDTWRQMEELVDEGLVRYIGMSNMTITKMELVLPLMRIKPVVLEVEINPGFQQPDLFAYAKEKGIVLFTFAPLGSPSRPARDRIAEDIDNSSIDAIQAAAKAHGIHPVQVCLKWAVQRGQVPIPSSVKPEQYISNLRCVTEDPLTDEEMAAIKAADLNYRLIKGQVFLWPEATCWEDLWDPDGLINGTGFC